MQPAEETKVIYYIDDEETPYLVKLAAPPHAVTLGDFKAVLNRPNHKYFFKSMDDDFGVVKEEIADERAHLPCFNGRVVGWLVSAGEGSNPSDGGSQAARRDAFTDTDSAGSLARRPPRSHDDKFRYKGLRINGHSKYGGGGAHQHQHQHQQRALEYETASVMSSELDSASLFDSQSEITRSGRSGRAPTDCSSVSHLNVAGRRRRRKLRPQAVSRASSYSSITDSTMSLNIITVSLNMDTVNFLGISIVGQSNKGGDGGIYVGSIMKGGAVALDGRIEPGDMILQVNDVNFENMSNDEAVRVLREVVQKPGPIKLVVAKCWDPNPKGYFTIPRTEPVRPIDPGAWVAHTAALREAAYPAVPPSVLGGSGASLASVPPDQPPPLSVNMDMSHVVRTMLRPDSGLEIRDRMWLKITIPNAFIGADVVEWVLARVAGVADRRDARKYASHMLKAGFIRHTVNKVTFSEQCYYVAGDGLCAGLSAMRIGGARSPSADSDTVAPLPNPSLMGTANYMPYSGSYNPHGYQPMPFKYTSCPASEHTTIYGYNREESILSGSGGSSGSDHLTAKEHHGILDGKSNSSGSQGEPTIPPILPAGNGNNNGTGSSSGGRRSHSSGSDRGVPPDHTRPVIFL